MYVVHNRDIQRSLSINTSLYAYLALDIKLPTITTNYNYEYISYSAYLSIYMISTIIMSSDGNHRREQKKVCYTKVNKRMNCVLGTTTLVIILENYPYTLRLSLTSNKRMQQRHVNSKR